jgi:polyphosphate kinase
VSLAAQSVLDRLPIDTSKVGVVGEMVARFQERAKWCSHLEASGLRVCDLVLGLADGRAHLVARLEEVFMRL